MSKLFPKHLINLDKGTVFNTKLKKFTGKYISGGHNKCNIKDIYGNKYQYIHEVIIAEGLQLPKHLWPTEPNGRRYIVDHITPVSNGGTNSFNNLHLIPKPDNSRNTLTLLNHSNASKKKWESDEFRMNHSSKMKGKLINRQDQSISVFQYTLDGVFIKKWDSASEAGRNGFNKGHICACCRGEEKSHKGFKWEYFKI